jgi:hypothetical protein
MQDFFWCLAPGCESGHIRDEGVALFDCIACGSQSCVNCNRLWHIGETCADYKLRIGPEKDREKASEAKVQKISKECPGCKVRIQKAGGCEHMTCKLFSAEISKSKTCIRTPFLAQYAKSISMLRSE